MTIASSKLGLNEIESRLPHRYENVLIDWVEPGTDPTKVSGQLGVNVGLDDPMGRQLFLKQISQTQSIVMPTVLMEILALGAIISTVKLKDGQHVFYAGISKFKTTGVAPAGADLVGSVEKLKDKGGFLLYRGSVGTKDTTIATGDMMAYFDQTGDADPESAPSQKVPFELPKFDRSETVDKSLYAKDAAMVTVDECRYWSADDNLAIYQYHFPTSHPLVKGHFPGQPVLMGVMQWMTLEDAVLHHVNTHYPPGRYVAKVSADLIKPDKTWVAQIKGCVVNVHTQSGELPYANITETQRIMFRTFVTPDETIYIRLNISVTPE